MRWKLNRGRSSASSRMRVRRAAQSRARLGRYQAARLNAAKAHARITGTWNVVMSQVASSRRRVGVNLSSERLAQHAFVERQIRTQGVETLLSVVALPHRPDFGDTQVWVLLLPDV